jgi:hypothetical protein
LFKFKVLSAKLVTLGVYINIKKPQKTPNFFGYLLTIYLAHLSLCTSCEIIP